MMCGKYCHARIHRIFRWAITVETLVASNYFHSLCKCQTNAGNDTGSAMRGMNHTGSNHNNRVNPDVDGHSIAYNLKCTAMNYGV